MGSEMCIRDRGGIEILVIDGSFQLNDDELSRHSWLRLPQGESATAAAGADGARIWIKRGHLRHIRVPS